MGKMTASLVLKRTYDITTVLMSNLLHPPAVGLRVPYLQPSIGDMLDVVVTLVSQLDQFTAQLYGQEIVHLSHQLR